MEYLPSNILAISYAKNILKVDSRERSRMKRYASRMNEHHIIVFTKKNEGFPNFQQDENLFLYATNANSKLGMVWSALKIGSRITKERRTENWIISSQDPFESSFVGRGIAKRIKAKHHVQIHGDVFNPLSYKESPLQYLRVIYGRFVVKHSSYIRAVSNRIKKSLIALGVKESAVTVLPIQADMSDFINAGESREYSIKDAVRFLYVGRFSREKNISLLIKAFFEAQKTGQAELVLVGDGPEKEQLSKLVSDLGIKDKVYFKGWTDDVSSEMTNSNVFCLSSNHEGWGMVLLEASATGMAVLTTDVGCAGDCVIDGESGKVVPVGDVDAYQAAMEDYIKNHELIYEHGLSARRNAVKFSLSEDEYLDKLVQSYYLK